MSIDHFEWTGSCFATCRHKDKELREHAGKNHSRETVSQSGFIACKFLLASKGRPVCNTLKMMTSILRAMASSAFCDFIRLASCLCFLPRKVLFDREATQDTWMSALRKYLFPCKVFRDCILPADSSFLGRNPAQPTRWEALPKASMSMPISEMMHIALYF